MKAVFNTLDHPAEHNDDTIKAQFDVTSLPHVRSMPCGMHLALHPLGSHQPHARARDPLLQSYRSVDDVCVGTSSFSMTERASTFSLPMHLRSSSLHPLAETHPLKGVKSDVFSVLGRAMGGADAARLKQGFFGGLLL